MAIPTTREMAEMRQDASTAHPVIYTKAQINAAIQAIEDWFEKPGIQANLKADVDAATAPLGITFTSAYVRRIVKRWLLWKYRIS